MVIAIGIIIGLMLACCGVAYKIGSFGKVYPIQSAAVLSIFGMLFFGLRGWNEWAACSWRMAAAGALFGVTQYLAIRLFRKALQLGPLSPAWCAVSLNFVAVVIYAGCELNEQLSVWQYFSIAATVGAILAAAAGSSGGTQTESTLARMLYGCLLVLILISGSVLNMGLKFCSVWSEPGAARPMIETGGDVIMFFTYLFMGGTAALDLTWSKTWRINRFAAWGGLLLSIGAITAYALSLAIIKAPAVIVFALSNSASILAAALISTFFMLEKRSASWYFTIGFSLLAILLNR